MSEYYGDEFQQKSKYFRGKLPRHSLDWNSQPKPFKIYDDYISMIELPKPEFKEINFWDVIIKRHSTRTFEKEPISIMDLSLLLYGMCGISRVSSGFPYRTTPSAGGLYPVEIYPVINNVEGLERGIYHYHIPKHSLEFLKAGDYRMQVAEACLGQAMARDSAVNFVWTVIIDRSKWKYLQRCYRYLYLDCGHIGQNFYLVSEALGLGACAIGALFDDDLNSLLEIVGKDETAIYVGVVGKKK